jgi:hypothetical protein
MPCVWPTHSTPPTCRYERQLQFVTKKSQFERLGVCLGSAKKNFLWVNDWNKVLQMWIVERSCAHTPYDCAFGCVQKETCAHTSVVHLTLDGVNGKWRWRRNSMSNWQWKLRCQSSEFSDGNAVIYNRYLRCHFWMTPYVHNTGTFTAYMIA